MPPHPVQAIEEKPRLRNGLPVQVPSRNDGQDAAGNGARRTLQLHPLLPLVSGSLVIALPRARIRGIEGGLQFYAGVTCHPSSLASTDLAVIPPSGRGHESASVLARVDFGAIPSRNHPRSCGVQAA